MKTRGKAVLTALGLTVLVAAISFAQPGAFMGGGGGGGRPGMDGGPGMGGGPAMEGELGGLTRALNALDLTDGQRAEIGTIMEDTRERIQDVRESVEGIDPRRELMELFLQEDISISDARAVFDEIDYIQAQVRDIMLEAFVEIHDVLTAEQLKRLAELIEQRRGMEGGPGMGGPGMDSPPAGGHGFGF